MAANVSTLTVVDLYQCLNEAYKSNYRCLRTLDDLSRELLWILPLESLTYSLHNNNLEFIKIWQLVLDKVEPSGLELASFTP